MNETFMKGKISWRENRNREFSDTISPSNDRKSFDPVLNCTIGPS